jgi:hypothetical protein
MGRSRKPLWVLWPTVGSNPTPSAFSSMWERSGLQPTRRYDILSRVVAGVPAPDPAGFASNEIRGEVQEWLNWHDWKSCVQRCTVGSNPTLSAIKHPIHHIPLNLENPPTILDPVTCQPDALLRSSHRRVIDPSTKRG